MLKRCISEATEGCCEGAHSDNVMEYAQSNVGREIFEGDKVTLCSIARVLIVIKGVVAGL